MAQFSESSHNADVFVASLISNLHKREMFMLLSLSGYFLSKTLFLVFITLAFSLSTFFGRDAYDDPDGAEFAGQVEREGKDSEKRVTRMTASSCP